MKKQADRTEPLSPLRRRAEKIVREREARLSEKFEPLSPEEMARTVHELRVHQIELELQNEELRRTQTVLDTQLARYMDLYDLAPVGYVTVTREGVISEANITAARMLGAGRGALAGQSFDRFVHQEDQDSNYLRRKQLFTTGETQGYDLRMASTDGTVFWAHLVVIATLDHAGAPACQIALTDITGRKKAG